MTVRSIATRRVVALAAAFAVGTATPVLVTADAQAAPKKPSVSIKTSAKTVPVGGRVTVSGKVSRSSHKATVRLQARVDGRAWRTVKTAKVSKKKSYKLRITVRGTSTAFRVKVLKNKKIRSATSKTVRVTGRASGFSAAQLQILNDTNDFRAANGRAPLTLMPGLNAVAQDWSQTMARTGRFEHRPNFFASYPAGATAGAENIAAGQRVNDVVDAWINSEGHRRNLLGDYTHLGVGYAEGGPYGRYFTQNFARY